MKTSFLLFWLEAPLQAWGYDSKFGRRDTLPFPTKSGVTGLLLCALGASGEQQELLSELAPLKQTILSFVRQNKKERHSRKPLLMDFHMVGSGYKDKDPWETNLIPMGWDGKKLTKTKTGDGKRAGSKLTYRYYLQDARFAVAMEIPSKRNEEFANALKMPVYDIFLGRKNCIPTDFIFRGLFDEDIKAINKGIKIARKKDLAEDFRVVDGEQEGDVFTLNDVPIQFGPFKKYRDRRVTVISNA